MNEEEKEAIEWLELVLDNETDIETEDLTNKCINNILNLIEKQQKEIEELKHDNSILCEIAYTGKRIQLPYTMVYTGTDNFISKDKIKEKIKEVESHIWKDGYMTKFDKYAIHYLKELLGE